MKREPRRVGFNNVDPLENIQLRRLQPGESIEQLTDLLRRAFARLGEMGVPRSCVCQSPELTRRRIKRGSCFVAQRGAQVVGTISVYGPDARSESRNYRNALAASAGQFGVDPQFQGQGIGSALLRLAERWARSNGYAQLALDTPEPARHLIIYYHRQGFRVMETLQFAGRPYVSVIFAKALFANPTIEHQSCFRHAGLPPLGSGSASNRYVKSQAHNSCRTNMHTKSLRGTVTRNDCKTA